MDIKIIKQEKKPLVAREEIEAQVIIEPTPSNKQIQEELAKKFNKNPELIVVKHIYSKFGSHENKIIAYVYDSKEALKKFEKIKQKKKEEQAEEKTEESKEKTETKKTEEKQVDKAKENKE